MFSLMFNFPLSEKLTVDPRVEAFLKLAENWFNIKEAGVTDVRVPNLDEPIFSREEVKAWLDKLEGFFKKHLYTKHLYYDTETKKNKQRLEVNEYFKGKGIDLPPGFDELDYPAGLAFMQDWFRLQRKYPKE